MREPGPGGAEPLRRLGQGGRRDAAERELLEDRLECAEEQGAPDLRAEGPAADRVDGGGEEAVEGGAATRPQSRRRDDGVAQPFEGPALVDA